jgi:hypothetical protein
MKELSFISVTVLLILAFIATYFSIKNLMRWKEMEIDLTRARVFLDKSFLNSNFKLTFLLVGLLFLHFIIMEYHEVTGNILQGFNFVLYYVTFVASMLALVLLVYIWYKVLYKK